MQYQDAAGGERFAVRSGIAKRNGSKKGLPNITQARQWRASRMGRIAEGRLSGTGSGVAGGGSGFSDYAETWLTTGTGRWKQSTSAGNRSIVQTLSCEVRAQRLTAIDRRRCGGWRAR